MTKTIESIADLMPAPRNANLGTPRGRGMIEQSVRARGAGRSGLAAKDGTMIAGSQTLDVMAELGMEIIPVHTTGKQWVMVIRDDLDADSEEAELLGLDDNRAAEIGLKYDPTILASMAESYDLSGMFVGRELETVLASLPLNLDVGGIASDDEPQAFDGGELPPSYVRMVQLFFTSETQPEFLRMVQAIMPRLGQTNLTDTVFEAVTHAYRTLDLPDAT